LYSANDARTVAGTLNRSISGWQQWCPVRTATPSRSSRRPTSSALMGGSSMTNEITPAFFFAAPMTRSPANVFSRPVA
jgi:hypothetical protein